jgi:hypothetical protein
VKSNIVGIEETGLVHCPGSSFIKICIHSRFVFNRNGYVLDSTQRNKMKNLEFDSNPLKDSILGAESLCEY